MGQVAGEKMGRRSEEETRENAEKYARDMGPHLDARLEADRGRLVALYRRSPGSWPGGIDSKYDRWYRASEWSDAGEYIGERPCVRAANPDEVAAPAEPEKSKLVRAREVLAEAEIAAKKPWEAEGISRSTWDRQRKKGEI